MATGFLEQHASILWLVELVAFIVLIAGLIVAGPILGDRLTRRRGRFAKAVAPGLGCLLGGSLALVLVVYSVCHGPPPGEGPHAERGFARARPVLSAIVAYHARTGRYPSTLEELVGPDLPASALEIPPNAPLEYPLEYRATSDSFVLSFQHAGPGMNRCEYWSSRLRWHCSGHF